jgi:predicted ArsR family transcriptional regulator
MSDGLPYQRLERLFHEPARLAILALLVHEPAGIGFTELKDRLDLTFGNLDRHLKALVEAEVVEIEKRSGRGRPQTIARLGDAGRAQFLAYLDSLEQVLRAASQARGSESASDERPDGLGARG